MKYKNMLNVSTESVLDALPSETVPLPTTATDNTSDILPGIMDTGVEMTTNSDAIEILGDAGDALANIRKDVQVNDALNPLTAVAAEAYAMSINYVLRKTGLKNITVSSEAFDGKSHTPAQYSLEAIDATLNSIVTRIIELIKSGVEAAIKYAEKLFDGSVRYNEKVSTLLELAKGLSDKAPLAKEITVSGAQANVLAVDGKFTNVDTAPKMARVLATEIYGPWPNAVTTYINGLITVISGWVSDPSSFDAGESYRGIKPPMLNRVDPDTLVKTDYVVGSERIRFDRSESLMTMGWSDISENSHITGDVAIPVLSSATMVSLLTELKGLLDTIETGRIKIQAVNDARVALCTALEPMSTVESDGSDAYDGIRQELDMVERSTKSYAEFLLTSGAKLLHIVSACCDIVSLSCGAYTENTDALAESATE